MDKSNWKKYIFHFQGGHRVAMKAPPELLEEGLKRASEWIYTFDDDGDLERVVALQHALSIEVEEETDDDHASHCAEMDDDVPEFDPDYIYTERDGDEWECIDGRWITGDTHAERVAERKIHFGHDTPPAEYGPYRKDRLVPASVEQDDEKVLDPAYTYRDRHGETWEYLDGKWVQGDSRTDRLVSREAGFGLKTLPDRWGTYTRIEEEEASE